MAGVVLSGLFGTASIAQQKTVIELFTSQACSTCRPAERLMEKLSTRTDILALAFHVDYWDYTGWKDPFAKDVFSNRQHAYLNRFAIPFASTPQFIINGRRDLVGSDSDWVAQTVRKPTSNLSGQPSLTIRLVENNALRIEVGSLQRHVVANISLVRFSPSTTTDVTAGDNKGVVLTNSNVVRDWRTVALYLGEPVGLKVPVSKHSLSSDNFAVIVQETGPGPVLAASVLR